MSKALEQYLLEAEGKRQDEVSSDNPFGTVGFDGDKKRLGWARVITITQIEERLLQIDEATKGFENFIFVGMGGSVNGIKPLLALFKRHSIYTLDSLDPAALEEISLNIKDLERTLVIPISKSGTTPETQAIASTLKELFGEDWQRHFLWLSDPGSFAKLDSLGWKKTAKFAIQFDQADDIGGRFSCPHTLIFFLPLFLLLKRNLADLVQIYQLYLALQADLRAEALELAVKYTGVARAYFFPMVAADLGADLSSWLYQLFQESLGSKKNDFPVKTIVSHEGWQETFIRLPLVMRISGPVVRLMSHMYFFQTFVAFFAAAQGINFVDQGVVEKYKEQLRKLAGEKITDIPVLQLEEIVEQARAKLAGNFKFIDVVLYFHPSGAVLYKIKQALHQAFGQDRVIVALGSDWNHHSYQATFGDQETLFLFLVSASYNTEVCGFGPDRLEQNCESLKAIAKASHLTLPDKSLLLAFSEKAGEGLGATTEAPDE